MDCSLVDKVSSSSSLSIVLIRKFAKQIECVKVIVINMQNRFAVTQLFIEKMESLVGNNNHPCLFQN